MIPQAQATLQQTIQALQDENFDLANLILKSILQANIDNADNIFKLGMTYANHNKFTEALTILSCLQPYKNDDVRIPYNLGFIYSIQGKHQLALEAYDGALRINPKDPETLINKGATLIDLNNYTLALEVLDNAIRISPDIPEAWSNKAIALKNLDLFEESQSAYDEAVRLKPTLDWIYGDFLVARMRMCMWADFQIHVNHLISKASENEKVVKPFAMLALSEDASVQKKSSEIYTQDKYPENIALAPIPKYRKKEKIRIGYFSPDFHTHPVAHLTSELFELHDKNHFELFAFSLQGTSHQDEVRERLKNAFDHFIDAENMRDLEIAKLARELEIDIAIDLAGHTKNSKLGIFSYRAAPIQVNWLGYPGTLGAQFMDYIVADNTLIPSQLEQFYSEKIVRLPHSYQVNDRRRVIAEKQFSRQQIGLPQEGFVYCCFNNNYKILPDTFNSWMRILKAVNGSVLWLLQDSPVVAKNLKNAAEKCGVDEKRLIFAERMPVPEHLARHFQADLFIDTFPYNAHTTASDALWAGLPVLTLMGESFASRVAASLLNAINLPELVTTSQMEYESLAVKLANQPGKLDEIRSKLEKNRLTSPLFDTPLFAKNLEAAYIKMYERYRLGLEPEHITIF